MASPGKLLAPLVIGLCLISSSFRLVGQVRFPGRSPVFPGRTAEVIRNLTTAQRIHAKLHVDPYDYREQPDQVLDQLVSITQFRHRIGGLRPSRSTVEVLSEFVCSADAVFVGQVRGATALPTLTGAFLFTDYQVQITNLIRVRPALSRPPFQVVVTRLGGVTYGDGTEIRTVSSAWPLLEVGGTYVFFGTLIPDTGAFISQNTDVLRIMDGNARAVAGLNNTSDLSWYEGLSESTFADQARALTCSAAGEAGQ